MALLGKIRNNPWLLIVVIALGLGGFLLMDMMNAGGPGGGLSQLVVGKVNGEKVRRDDFEREFGLRYNGSSLPSYQNRNSLWNWYVEKQLLEDEAAALGLGVSGDEITELEYGQNVSPIIRSNFSNPQAPGQVDRQQLDYLKNLIETDGVQEAIDQGQLSDQFPAFWRMQRRMIVKDRLQSKLQSLVQKAMYTPTWMAEMGYNEQNQRVDFLYVQIPYDQVAAEAPSDSDLSSYLSANAGKYTRKQEQRTMDYVAFDVIPTAKDSSDLRNKLVKLRTDYLATEESDSTFVLKNNGIISPAYSTADDLSTGIADTVMSMPVGSVYGPYSESGEFRLVKVIERKEMADSATSRHILLLAQSVNQFGELNERADSIINVLRTGATSFDSLAVALSDDTNNARTGGKLEGVVPNAVPSPEYNELLFAGGQLGTYYKIRTPFGIYVMEILSRTASTTPRVQVAYLREAIVPSKATQNELYQRASRFIVENRSLEAMRAAADQDPSLRVVSTPAFDQTAFTIGDLGFSNDTKNAVCWAFSADVGDVSADVYSFRDNQRYFDNKYVVVGLSNVFAAGKPTVDQVRNEITAEVANAKKTDIVASTLDGANLSTIAGKYGVQVDTIRGATFERASMPGLGNEPMVVATAVGLEQGQTSGAIQGNGGVYVVYVINKPTVGAATNLPQVRQRMSNTARGQVASTFMSLFRDQADVNDNRSTYECN